MIVPMKKVSLVVLNKFRKQALVQLKETGVLHIEEMEGTGEVLSSFKEAYSSTFTAVSILSEIKLPKKSKIPTNISSEVVLDVCKKVIALSDEKKKIQEDISAAASELERLADWGEVNPLDFDELLKKGISLKMYEIPYDKYAIIDDSVKTISVNVHRKVMRFLALDVGDERPEGLPAEAFEVPMPECSTSEFIEKIKSDKAEISKIDSELERLAVNIRAIENFRSVLESDIQFETIYSGMGKENEGKDSDLAWLSGFVPIDSLAKLKDAAAKNSWALAYSDPSEEDEVPTKLKNNRFVSLIYPLTDFLGTVPGYREYDISGWFLLFFTVFFGMIFGDGGYGLLVSAICFVLILKKSASKQTVPPVLPLVLLLGIATVLWGTVTCTWFGLTPAQLPDWLVKLSVPPLSNAYSDVTWAPFWKKASSDTLSNAQNLQIFCFTLALIQLSVAHFKGIARNFKSLKCIGEIGALLQVVGMFYIVLSMVVSSTVFSFSESIYDIPVGTVSIAMVGLGFLLSFIFSNYEGSVLQSILASVKGIISVLLGVVNIFSDIVSYIRLWAVGLAGAAISNTVNTMAGPVLGHAILFIAAIALLVFGHGLNMVLNLLSVIVHGVRLNTLEFSTHLGMSWSGFKYSPFSNGEK